MSKADLIFQHKTSILQEQYHFYRNIHIACDIVYELWVMVFNATFNNISAISWRLVLLGNRNTQRKPWSIVIVDVITKGIVDWRLHLPCKLHELRQEHG